MCWWKHIDEKLRTMGFMPSQFDQSFYVLRRGADVCMIWVHVDDGAVTGSNLELIRETEAQLKEHIKIKWSDALDTIVGLKVDKVNDRHYTLSQPFLTEKILSDNADLLTPLSANSPLKVGTVLKTDVTTVPTDPGRFLSIIGSLSYLAVGTRPDLAYAVNFLARYASTPQKEHWNALKHVLRFVRNTARCGLTVHPAAQRFKRPIETFLDANWGGEFA